MTSRHATRFKGQKRCVLCAVFISRQADIVCYGKTLGGGLPIGQSLREFGFNAWTEIALALWHWLFHVISPGLRSGVRANRFDGTRRCQKGSSGQLRQMLRMLETEQHAHSRV